MNGTEEDEFSEFLGLPSEIGALRIPNKTGGGAAHPPEPRDTYSELYGAGSGAGQTKMETDYDDLFGPTETTTHNISFEKTDIQTVTPSALTQLDGVDADVDEDKIQPKVALGSNLTQGHPRNPLPPKEEFTIVLDPSSSDPRMGASGNVPVADWVVPSGHTRREPMLVRQTTGPHHGVAPSPRPAGLHTPSGGPHGPMHGRSTTGSTGNRAVRIPAGCNPDLEPEFPTRAAPDQALKLPGQTRVTPDEYKEFLGLGHGEIFNLDLDRVADPPWRAPGADTTDFFNYGLDESSWKAYCKAIECHRQEFSMKKKIQTYESSNVHFQQDPDLPPEVAAAIAAETYQARTGTGPDMNKALPIPVFQGVDDYSLRTRRGRDFRRPEVRYDPEVILELAGGVEPSSGVNADYGEDYIGPFAPGDLKGPDSRAPDKTGPDGSAQSTALPGTDSAANNSTSDLPDDPHKTAKEDTSAMFREDEFEDPRSRGEIVRPGELAAGMEADPQQISQSWPSHRIPPGAAGAPPRPDFNRMYETYGPPHDMWRPFYGGRGWRPRGGPYDRGPPEFWGPGRNYGGRGHPEGGRGRFWNPYGGPRRPGRRPPPPRYYDEYRPPYYPPWTRREERPPPPLHEPSDDPRSTEKLEHPVREAFPQPEAQPYRERDRRRHPSTEREEERPRSHPRLRGREDYGERPFTHHRDRSRDYGWTHRREDYEDRHRDRRRRKRSVEKDVRRRSYSKERSRGRDRDDRRSRRYESQSDSESGSRYRGRSKERD